MSRQAKTHERVNQKKRTRSELLRAARELMDGGAQPTVAEVADHADISRATAYRYFSTQEDLLREAALDGIAKSIDVRPPDPDAGPAERVVHLVDEVMAMVEKNEPMFRALLASTVSGENATRRGGRRMGWLSEALEPLRGRLPERDFRRLSQGLGLMCGIETLVVLKDVCELDADEARDVARWAARKLVEGVLAETGD